MSLLDELYRQKNDFELKISLAKSQINMYQHLVEKLDTRIMQESKLYFDAKRQKSFDRSD